MNTRERFHAVMNFERVRTLKTEYGYWSTTIKRFIREGMPVIEKLPENLPDNGTISGAIMVDPESSVVEEKNIRARFNLDSYAAKFPIDFSPFFKIKVLEENEEYKVYTDEYGITVKKRKSGTSAPLYIDFPIKNRSDFYQYREHYGKDYSKRLPKNWRNLCTQLRDRDFPVRLGGYPFGFFGFPRHLIGFPQLYYLLYDDPKLIHELNDFFLNFCMQYWAALFTDFQPDCVLIWEDMASKTGSLISPAMFREFMTPYYKKLIDYFTQYGIKNILVDSDGYIEDLLMLWNEVGVTGIFPVEIQAGNDILRIRDHFPKMQLFGGIDKRILTVEKSETEMDAELEKVKRVLRTGGYIPHMDHHIPDDACWKNFQYYRKRLNKIIDESVESSDAQLF